MSVEVLKLQHEAETAMKAARREKEIMVLAVGDIDTFQDTIQKAIEAGGAGRPQDETVSVMGKSGAEVLAQNVRLASTETRTLPLIVRVSQDHGLGRAPHRARGAAARGGPRWPARSSPP